MSALLSSSDKPRAEFERIDWLLSLLVLLGALGWSFAWWSMRQYGDGPRYLSLFSSADFGPHPAQHWAYLPAGKLLESVMDALGIETTPTLVLQSLSAIAVSIGIAASWCLARAMGASRRAAGLAVLVVGLTPALMFFGRIVEVHALHFGVSASVFASVALFSKQSPWRAVVLVLVLGPWLFLTHSSGIMLYAGLALVALQASGLRWNLASLAIFAGVSGLALIMALTFAAHQFGVDVLNLLQNSSHEVAANLRPNRWATFVKSLLVPIAFAWPFILIGLKRGSLSWRLVILATCVPEILFFTWWGVQENGAYSLGYLPILLACAALGFDAFGRPGTSSSAARVRRVLPGLAIGAQALLGGWTLLKFDGAIDANFQVERRLALAQAFEGDAGPKVLLSFDTTIQSPCDQFDQLLEVKLIHPIIQAQLAGILPTSIAAGLEGALQTVLTLRETAGATFYFDRTYHEQAKLVSELEPYAVAVEVAFRQRFVIVDLAGGAVWRLEFPSNLPR